ncbi:MAG: hypothetical protein JWR19_4528 [Pedosphaera sp.]|nr:hypothetical protein [Pedosphaera sp.]
MSSRFQSRGWRLCRKCLRGLRIAILFLIFLLIAVGFYVNQIGLPGFLKRPLIDNLHARGVDFQFTRLRLRYYRGIVAENVRFGKADAPANGPKFSAREVELRLNHSALAHFKLTIDALVLHGGQFVWPLVATNQPPKTLSVDDIETQLRLLPNDQWKLDRFLAAIDGAKMQLSASVTNASAIRDWNIFHARAEAQPELLQRRLREFADTLEHIKFADTPELKLDLHGDGRDPRSFGGLLTATTLGAATPWGTLTNGNLVVQLLPPDATNSQPHGQFSLRADGAHTRWGNTRNFQLDSQVVMDAIQTNLIHCRLELLADQFETQWARATNAQFTASWSHSFTNAIPIAGQAVLRLADAHTSRGSAGELRLEARLNPTPGGPLQADQSWAWWANLEPYALDWNCRLTDVRAEEFQVKEVAFSGAWRAPELTITNLHSELYRGQLNLKAALNVATRAVTFTGSSDFDAQKITPLLTEQGRHWLSQFSWENPPLASGEGGLILSSWTNRHPDWHGEVLPTLWLKGEFQAGPSSFRTVPVLSARSHVIFSNLNWNLPDLVATRPEGELHLEHIANDRTHDYYFRIHSEIDLKAARPLLEPKGQRVLDELVLTQPPIIDAEIWGRWHEYEQTGIKAHVTITNYTFRGEPGTWFQSDLRYTNYFLLFDHPRAERGIQYAKADTVGVDFLTKQLFLTNGYSIMEPTAIIHAIGSKVTKTMEPYRFLQPPTVQGSGIIPLEDNVAADAHFWVDGGPFRWTKFNLTHVLGGVNWVGDRLTLSDMQAIFYQGRLTGSAVFDFTNRREGTDFSFDAIATDANLQLLLADLYNSTNRLEGTLNGHLNITNANSHDWQSWFGQGQVDLHKGFIWEIPIFGVFSQPLDSIVPGLGKSRASEGSATFIITNSVVRSDDLEIRSPALRMLYRGTVDFDGKVDAHVEAELLRDAWLVGRVVSMALWPLTKIFEYKVTGTLKEPKLEPLYLPTKMLLMPFHPIRSLKEMFPPGDSTSTNAPPPAKSP